MDNVIRSTYPVEKIIDLNKPIEHDTVRGEWFWIGRDPCVAQPTTF